MARTKSSARWLQEHFNDPFVKKAQEEGYRSRASYKLLELDKKDRLIKPGMVVVDLGAAPGGWSQVAARKVGKRGKVLASDILEMPALPNVEFIQGDFTENEVYERILTALGGQRVDLVISDMAPNMSGIGSADIARAMNLVELALDFTVSVLKPDGAFVCKVFQGAGFEELLRLMRSKFSRVNSRKPEASRPRSREQYFSALGFRG